MGKRDREQIERIRAKLEDPISRQRVRESSYEGVVRELSKGNIEQQTSRLDTLVGEGSLASGKLRDAIAKNAPKEMDKAIRKFQKKGREVTVESLLAEVRKEQGFLKMCERVGLDYGWFETVARERMEVHGL